MSSPAPFSNRRWLLFPLCAALFILATDYGRIRQVERITAIGRGDEAESGRHWLIIPEHNTRGYQWLAETEQMLTTGPWRIRRVDYENSPVGREVLVASSYRWWLGLLARADQALSGRSPGASVERAALWSGPLLHLLLLAGSTVLVARRFGPQPAALVSIGVAVLFPFAGVFAPGVPDDHGLVIACAWGSVLLLAAGRDGERKYFILAGVAGGLGLWLDAATQLPVLAGIGGGALLRAVHGRFSARGKSPAAPLPWNLWALAGAVTSLLAYLAEYYPDHLEMRLQVNHPLDGVAWLGLDALLTLAEAGRTPPAGRNVRTLATLLLALAGLAALPVALHLTGSPSFLEPTPEANRLTALWNGPVAPNLATWLTRDGPLLAKLAVLLPLFLLVPAGWSLLKPGAGAGRGAFFAGGVLAACLIAAGMQLHWWAMAQLALLTLLALALPPATLRTWLIVTAALLPGSLELARSARPRDESQLTRLEAESLVERDLAHWIARHAPGGTVLAAPERTPGLYFHGGLRGLGTPNRENSDGVTATVHILGATTADEAQALLNQRGVTHLILASWDGDLDEFLRLAGGHPEDSFLSALHRWALPPWVQPVPYRLPAIAGFEEQTVVVLKITEDTDRALALSRLAEYALEMEDQALATATSEILRNYPANLMALIGRAQIEKARGDAPAFDRVSALVNQSLASGLDRLLPWDRRVSLAVVLAQGGRNDAAKKQLQRCLAELDEARLRSLNAGALYRLLVLGKAYDLPIAPDLRAQALTLLPAEARARL